MTQASDTTRFRPDRLDVRRFAHESACLEGQIPLSALERLREDAFGLDEKSLAQIGVSWRAQGIWRELRGGAGETRMHLFASVDLPMQCQRCLDRTTERLQVDREFLFVADEAAAERLDEESEDDVLVASKNFDLIELIEDELLMALPLVPRHEHCSTEFQDSSDFGDPGHAEEVPHSEPAERQNPFLALKSLKKH